MWVKKAGPEGTDIMSKLQCKNEGFHDVLHEMGVQDSVFYSMK